MALKHTLKATIPEQIVDFSLVLGWIVPRGSLQWNIY